MFNSLKEKVKNKKVIIIGEDHGIKEAPRIFSEFFSDISKEEDFNLCLEIPQEFQNMELERILSLAKKAGSSGLINEHYIELIKTIPKNVKIFFVSPSIIKNQEGMEIELSNNILKLINNKKTFAILGEVHASKNKMRIKSFSITPAGFFIKKKLGNKFYNIRIAEKNKEINEEEKLFNKGFDEIIEIEKFTYQ